MFLSRDAVRRGVSAVAGTTLAASLLVAVSATAQAAPTPPPNPTDGQISAAQAHKNAVAARIGELGGQIAAAQGRLRQLQSKVELAEQKVALAISLQRQAEDDVKKANARREAANDRVRVAHTKFVQYIQAQYMDGRPEGMTGTLLSAQDPSDLLDQSSYQQYEADHKLSAVGQMQRASVAKSNADAAARKARDVAKKRTTQLKVAAENAHVAYSNQQNQKVALENSMDDKQAELVVARRDYQSKLDARDKYDAFVEEQRRLAEIRRQKRIAERERQERAAAAAAAARKNKHRNNGGGGGGNSFSPPRNSPAPPSGGNWSLSKARRAVNRAASTLGTPYAWAGGGAGGPSYGACVPSAGAPNDCNVYGYDCSGLVMYAWGRNWAHYAATQYGQAGRVHPSVGNLRLGDLLFYSNGGVAGIHHVAIYAGGGRIIEAPYSGGVVRYASMYGPGPIFGATRPLT